ncbi:GIY-YIG nuclease family protein [Verrucomicrobia bacterium]|nr:GIY-YIG nuclease family protein [Verrucomicrobiota bacterium]
MSFKEKLAQWRFKRNEVRNESDWGTGCGFLLIAGGFFVVGIVSNTYLSWFLYLVSIIGFIYLTYYTYASPSRLNKIETFIKENPKPSELDYSSERILDYSNSDKNGFVYILTNDSFPGLIKVGMTDGDPKERARKLSTTSVPHPFKVFGCVQVHDPQRIEKLAHKKLINYRESQNREFFKIEPEEALKLIERISGQVEYYNKERARQQKEREKELKQKKQREYLHNKYKATKCAVYDKFYKGSKLKHLEVLEKITSLCAIAFGVATIIPIYLIGLLPFEYISGMCLMCFFIALSFRYLNDYLERTRHKVEFSFDKMIDEEMEKQFPELKS